MAHLGVALGTPRVPTGLSRIMLPLLALAGIMLAGGLIVGKFGLPRPVDTRMLIGGVMMISGLGFLFQGLAHLF